MYSGVGLQLLCMLTFAYDLGHNIFKPQHQFCFVPKCLCDDTPHDF